MASGRAVGLPPFLSPRDHLALTNVILLMRFIRVSVFCWKTLQNSVIRSLTMDKGFINPSTTTALAAYFPCRSLCVLLPLIAAVHTDVIVLLRVYFVTCGTDDLSIHPTPQRIGNTFVINVLHGKFVSLNMLSCHESKE